MTTSRIHLALEHHQRGRLAEAESIYRELLAKNAADADALHYLGVLRMAQGKPAEAVDLIRRALKLSPRNAQAWNNLGNVLWHSTEPQLTELAYRNATNLDPRMVTAWFNLGRLLHRQQRHEEALGAFDRALQLQPRYAQAHEFVAILHQRMGRPDLAAAAFRRWHELDPENPIARHMAAAHAADAGPQRADDAYVVSVFDRAANHFDQALAGLHYAAPQLLTAALAGVIPFAERRLRMLDAGCGTGLCGPLLRSSAHHLVGVDLSPGMLAKARERQVYDELHESELVAFMRSHANAYDVIVSADTLVYFGALEEVLAAAAASLLPGGILAFTAESEPPDSVESFRLHGHGRYTHAESYIRAGLTDAGFAVLHIEPGVLRKEAGTDVHGHVVIAKSRIASQQASAGDLPPVVAR
jgi:predicted TPR repeat methyltransferase